MLKQIDKEKVLMEFNEKYVLDQWAYKFLEADEIYKSDKEAIEENLMISFEDICKKATELQKNKVKGEIKYIYFSLLRTKILEYEGEYRVDLYDENWFLDKKETSTNLDLNFLYVPLFDFIRELKEKKKMYGRTITDMDVENIMLGEVNKFHVLAVEFLRNTVEKFVTTPAYDEMEKADDIKILAGEYMDEAEIIYTP
ncbi:hypothetical protein [Clostridium beijerinckii]|uniref:hypothetical protein n=1 Tax=Clostridium beijerinckii TaxID=1520 RepID=UPI00080A0EC8|nr:hypothetical protein [Clostridium beijerinckii]OCA96886.1 hypothetical protein BGS1_06435 [Clostridium beijerinckii]